MPTLPPAKIASAGRAGGVLVFLCLGALACAKTSGPSSDPTSESPAETTEAKKAPVEAVAKGEESTPTPPSPAKAGRPAGTNASFAALSDAEVAAVVEPALQPGEKLAHKAFRGPFGPSPETVLAIVDRSGDVAAFALVPAKNGAPSRIALPGMMEGSLDSVAAVLFANADKDSDKEAVIMTLQMTGAGPQGAIPRPFNFVIDWTGKGFSRMPDVEEIIADMETGKAIKAALKKIAPQ